MAFLSPGQGGGSAEASVPPTPAAGMFASVRLCAHSQMEPHRCLAHSAGGECQLPRRMKTQQLSVMRLKHALMKKCEGQMLKQIEELLFQKRRLWEHLARIKRESKEEEECFLQEISRFNSDFSLRGNRETVFMSQTHTEFLDLEREVESLYKEMELMSSSNSHMSAIQEEKRALQLELQDLNNSKIDLDQQLSVTKELTESLKEESLFVSQKPLTDNTCFRLRQELKMLKMGELELLQEALSSEIQSLQSILENSQGNEQH
ncbi:coiled-coil domain-containing protein 172-like [Echeneis naucrates]|uniref:coiled-coil domain-containing protein 172-like n=1 Tax=Echeneis naucrates TaxID=173247 RepID=UPI0011141A50|nr:coiled-coil domain-containing protein 172-like [Echeneis naucrates]